MRILCLLLTFSPFLSVASTSSEKLAARVIELRKEVELINDEYKAEREKVLNELKALTIQKAELDSNIRSEEIRGQQLQEKIENFRKDIAQSSVESESLKPLLLENLQTLHNYIQTSLPFQTSNRLAAITDLKTKVEKAEISMVKAATQLWALIEDERRLAQETTLHKLSIPLEGELNLAEVVKVGMLFLYFKTEDGRVGMAQKDGQGAWSYRLLHQDKDIQQIGQFVLSMKKQIRQGFFELPTGRL